MSLVICFGSLIFNVLLGYGASMVGFSCSLIVCTAGLWAAGRWSRCSLDFLGLCTVLIAFPALGGAWILFDGSDGMTPPLLFWMICLMFLFEQRKMQILVLLSILGFVLALFIGEALYPELIQDYYANENARYTDVAITYLLALSGYCFLVFSMTWLHMDTSKRLQQEQALRAKLEQQNIKDRAREREEKLELLRWMSRGLAHDLNNLLMVISNSAEMIDEVLSNQASPDDEMVDDLGAVIDTAAAATRLTRRLLDQSLTHDAPPEVISIRSFLEGQAPILSRISQAVTIHLDVGTDPAPAMIHRSELEQVIMNLALNAIQAMSHRGELLLRCRAHDRTVTIEIEDTGSGISPEHIEHIFEPLFTTKRDDGGTGLGLSTVQDIVHRYSGTIAVDSRVGEGTRFTLELPLVGIHSACSTPVS